MRGAGQAKAEARGVAKEFRGVQGISVDAGAARADAFQRIEDFHGEIQLPVEIIGNAFHARAATAQDGLLHGPAIGLVFTKLNRALDFSQQAAERAARHLGGDRLRRVVVGFLARELLHRAPDGFFP